MSRRFLSLLPAVLVLAACSDRQPLETSPAPPPVAAPGRTLTALRCSAVLRTETVACRPLSPEQRAARALIVGGQDQYVRMAADSIEATTETFSFDATVQNLMPVPIGTPDGTTADSVRVFFESDPVAFGGGSVTVDADGTGFFTAAEQPFYSYPGPLHPRDVSVPRRWTFFFTAPVDSFAFTVLVSAPTPHEQGWVTITPVRPTLAALDSLQLSAEVRDPSGQVVAADSLVWASLNSAVATVDAVTGLVIGVAPGTTTITATAPSLGRSGFVVVTVTPAGADSAAPTLSSLTLSPTELDSSSVLRTVEVLVRAFDRGSGVDSVSAVLNGPGGTPQRACVTTAVFSGDARDGTWRCLFTLPVQEVGTWTLLNVNLVDSAGNRRQVSTADLREAALPYSLQVRPAAADSAAPVLSGFSFAPRAIDVSADSAVVTFTIAAADAGSGVQSAQVSISRFVSRTCTATVLVGGTEADAVLQCQIVFPTNTASGEWRVDSLTLTDHAGNAQTLSGEQLEGSGFPVTLEVTNPNNDQAAPEITDFTFTPPIVSTAAGPANVQFSVTLTDEIGAASVLVTVGMDGQTPLTCTATAPSTGTRQNGVFVCTVTFPPGSAAGDWTVQSVRVEDTAGNARTIPGTELEGAGFSTTIVVS